MNPANTIEYLVSVLAKTQEFLKEHKAHITESKMIFEKRDEDGLYQATITVALDRGCLKS